MLSIIDLFLLLVFSMTLERLIYSHTMVCVTETQIMCNMPVGFLEGQLHLYHLRIEFQKTFIMENFLCVILDLSKALLQNPRHWSRLAEQWYLVSVSPHVLYEGHYLWIGHGQGTLSQGRVLIDWQGCNKRSLDVSKTLLYLISIARPGQAA